MTTARDQIHAKSGPVKLEDLRAHYCEQIPGLIDATARVLGVSSAQVVDLARAGELVHEDLQQGVAELEEGRRR